MKKGRSKINIIEPDRKNPQIEIINDPYDDPVGIEIQTNLDKKLINKLVLEEKLIFNEKESDSSCHIYDPDYNKL